MVNIEFKLMKLIKTEDACGHVLCHDLTQIIVGVTKDARFRKGHVVQKEDIPVLLSMGKENLYVWEMNEDLLHEDQGAEILCEACKDNNMEASLPKEGKIELRSTINGVFCIDVSRLQQINGLGQMMIATISNHSVVRCGDKLAGMRVIPLVIEKERMEKVSLIANAGHPLLSIAPFAIKNAAIIVTGSEVLKGRIKDTFSSIVVEKLAEYGVKVTSVVNSGDEKDMILSLIKKAQASGTQMIICTGGMSVDPDDRTPSSIVASGARVVSYGAPILPGAMFLLSYLDEVPLLGLPGCVMYAKRTVFDLLLPRILARIDISAHDLSLMGNGGLCLNCPECHFPNCGFGKGGF